MKKKSNQDVEQNLFFTRQVGSVTFLSLKENLLLRITDLDQKEQLLEHMENISQDPLTKVLVIVGSPEKTGAKEYFEFYYRLCHLKFDRNAIYRMYNAVDQLILKITEFKKPVIHADSGRLIPLYLNVSLACDYRIISKNAVFQNAYLDLGLLPKGGGVFFLTKMLGKSKAFDLLLREDDITANQALDLGIVDQVVFPEKLDETAFNAAKRFENIPDRTLFGLRRLMGFSQKELAGFLERENLELMRIIDSQEFRKELGQCPE